MKIEVWTDFTCPFCYIGKTKLDVALENFEYKQFINLEFKSYQLNPRAESNRLTQPPAMQSEKACETNSEILKQAEAAGLNIKFDQLENADTFHAHRLVKLAQTKGKESALVDLLFYSYFTDCKNIEKRDVLLEVAKKAGLDEEEADSLLCLNRYAKAVHIDQEDAEEMGIDDIPFFIFDEQYAICGVQPVQVFLDVLNELWDEEKLQSEMKQSANPCKGSYCVGDDCEE